MSSNDEEISDSVEKNDFSECSLRRSKRKPSESSTSSEVGNHRHNKRIVKTYGDLICPVCDLTLRAGDVEPHYQLECEKLSKILNISSKFGSSRGRARVPAVQEVPLERNESSGRVELSSSSVSSIPSRSDVPIPSEHYTGDVNWPSTSSLSSSNVAVKNKRIQEGLEEFKRVKVNRLLRRQCIKWKAKSIQVDETICPVCQEPVPVESAEELQVHADGCLRKQQMDISDEEEEVDVMGDEYEWCGMKKIRITSLLKSQGQLEALGTMITKGNEDEDVDVCVQSSNEDILGPPQYFQQDLDIAPNTSLERSLNGLETESDSETNSIEDLTSGNQPEETEGDTKGPSSESEIKNLEGSQAAIIAALQMKIAEMEERGTFICHICHGPYIVPVTSTICWHVHCEKCWLQALSSQKLCPQCKCIVSPTDLRKIYL